MEGQIIEILAGGGIETAFKELGIEATCTYKNPKATKYEIWEVAEDDMMIMKYTPSWPAKYGWFSYDEDRVLLFVNPIELTVNNKTMYGGNYEDRIEYNNLQEYFIQSGIDTDLWVQPYSYIKGLAEQNKMTMTKLFITYLG